MSHYVECTPGFKERAALIEALVAVGFDRSQSESHDQAVPLYSYLDDQPWQTWGSKADSAFYINHGWGPLLHCGVVLLPSAPSETELQHTDFGQIHVPILEEVAPLTLRANRDFRPKHARHEQPGITKVDSAALVEVCQGTAHRNDNTIQRCVRIHCHNIGHQQDVPKAAMGPTREVERIVRNRLCAQTAACAATRLELGRVGDDDCGAVDLHMTPGTAATRSPVGEDIRKRPRPVPAVCP